MDKAGRLTVTANGSTINSMTILEAHHEAVGMVVAVVPEDAPQSQAGMFSNISQLLL